MSDGINHSRARRDTFEIGMCPPEAENGCPQVGEPDYRERALEWCNRYRTVLKKLFPLLEQLNVQLKVKANPHDFGTYYELIAEYDRDSVGAHYVIYMEHNLPAGWEDKEPYMTWDEWRMSGDRAMTLWGKRIALLKAECNACCEPFNQRIAVVEELCKDLYDQAKLDFDTEEPSLEQLVEHYGTCAGKAVYAMMQEEQS